MHAHEVLEGGVLVYLRFGQPGAGRDLDGAALDDAEVLRLSTSLVMTEAERANAAFPLRRFARVTLYLRDGRALKSNWTEPKWEHVAPPTADELAAKFLAYAEPVIGKARARRIAQVVSDLENRAFIDLRDLLCAPAVLPSPARR